MPAPSASAISAALLHANRYWSGSQLTYSVPGPGAVWPNYADADGEPDSSRYATLNATQAGNFRLAIGAWDQVIALRIVEVTESSGAPGDIRIAFTDTDAVRERDVDGYTYGSPTVGEPVLALHGDIWLDYEFADFTFVQGGPAFYITLHELGHVFGLAHPFEGGSPLPAEYDNNRYSVMSYTPYTDFIYRSFRPADDGNGLVAESFGVFPSTPMVFDVLALQARYGADTATGAGDTSYFVSDLATVMKTIHDAGGTDTFSFASHTYPAFIDLTPGSYSSIGIWTIEEQIAFWAEEYPASLAFITAELSKASTYTWQNNLGIAYGTVIENVIAGSDNDTVRGNDVANNVSGRLGNDSIDGGAGDDYLRGDEGNDRIAGGSGFDDINGNMGDDTAGGGLGGDWVVGGKDNDRLSGEDGDDIVYGNLGADTGDGGDGADLIRGGQGDDSLAGGAGADWLSGDRDNDTLSGGAGADIFHSFGEAGIDRILDFNRAEGDRLQLDPGTTFTFAQSGLDVVISMGGGGQVVLVGVTIAALVGDWIFGN